MASSASGQDEPNRMLWLATQVGKMEPSCPLGTTHCIPQAKFHQKPYDKSFIDQVCSVKMAEYWPCSFSASLLTSTSPRSINTQKKELGHYPAILTSHLVNNPYIWIPMLLSSVAEIEWSRFCINYTWVTWCDLDNASRRHLGFHFWSRWFCHLFLKNYTNKDQCNSQATSQSRSCFVLTVTQLLSATLKYLVLARILSQKIWLL